MLVSVVTAVYNSERVIRDCILSVQSQTYSQWEHILVDDCSRDGGPAIIQDLAKSDPRIRYHRLTVNSGPGIARNQAIELARGRFIAFLDSDDVWHPHKLEKQIHFMLSTGHPFTFTSYNHMDAGGKSLKKEVAAPIKVTYKSALLKNPIGCLTAVYDSRFYGKQYMPAIRKRQDYALWLRLLKKADGYGLQEVLASYRTGNDSVSSNKLSLVKYEWLIYRKEEGLSLFRSLFYVASAIFLKLKSYF